MARTVDFIQRHISYFTGLLGIVGCIVGFWSAAQANNELCTKEKIGIESRLVRLETKVDLILEKLSYTKK